ncbi:hypothetical protein GCM10007868_18090 [Gluconobacter frateurii]|uniref:Uncharacterized protein n=1 Tax=Gluconobacter frateurii NRIC 0228 TaxID=1307946 RepID=A0ABQ0QFG5_9PROT|nr:hypothetical protein AA0228_2936 [Gluconobacter frateurii NRIC 0228]GLP90734.1 hypothetical protein GCM10007868_18090 [Gluconobacter frateurii]
MEKKESCTGRAGAICPIQACDFSGGYIKKILIIFPAFCGRVRPVCEESEVDLAVPAGKVMFF